MIICIITSWFPSKVHPNVAPFVYDFAKNLRQFGFSVSVITKLEMGEDLFTVKDGVEIYRVSGKSTVWSISKLVYRIKPDILHVHAPNYFSSAAIIVGYLTGIPTIATLHRAEVDIINKPVQVVRKLVLSRFQKLVAVSDFTKSLALKAGVDKNKISVINNSCNEEIFFQREKCLARIKCGIPFHEQVILFVGNIIRIKGVYTLVESFRIIRSKPLNFLAIIVGQGIEEDKLKSLLESYGLSENVKCIGWLPPEKLAEVYNASDVFVLPSFIEGHSVASLEAMASGVPIVASKIPANRDIIIDGVNGLLFESGNAADLAEKITSVLTDINLREKMSSNCCSLYHQKYSIIKQMEKYSELYSSLLQV